MDSVFDLRHSRGVTRTLEGSALIYVIHEESRGLKAPLEIEQAAHWTGGSLDRWLIGSLANWIGGTSDKRHIGSVAHRIVDNLDRWCVGLAAHWIGGSCI